MAEAIRSLRSRGVNTIKLDATPAGRPVYAALGFTEETRVERWIGTARAAGKTNFQMWRPELRQELMGLDRRAFGAERAALLDSLVFDSSVMPLTISAPDGELQGYALARRGALASYIGPVVATDQHTAASLIDGMSEQLNGRDAFIDLNMTFEDGAQITGARGFVKQREFIRMRFGPENSLGTSGLIFAIAGPEIG